MVREADNVRVRTGGDGTCPEARGEEEVVAERGEPRAQVLRQLPGGTVQEPRDADAEVREGEAEHETLNDLLPSALEGEEGDEDEEATGHREAAGNEAAEEEHQQLVIVPLYHDWVCVVVVFAKPN